MVPAARLVTALAAALVLLLAACAGDDGSASPTDTVAPDQEQAQEPDGEPLRVLLANDDGIDHPGLDLMARALQEMDDVEVTVVAPADNRSGSSDATTPGGAPHGPGETASGIEGTAVDGLPADTVAVALDELGIEPHVIVSGINDAQNIGPFAAASGTVGVVRTGIRRDVPGVAVSAGLEFDTDEFTVAADLVVAWLTDHRDELVTGTFPTDLAHSFNVPACPVESMGELVEVDLAPDFPEDHGSPFESDCAPGATTPADDVAALRAGHPSLTQVPAEL